MDGNQELKDSEKFLNNAINEVLRARGCDVNNSSPEQILKCIAEAFESSRNAPPIPKDHPIWKEGGMSPERFLQIADAMKGAFNSKTKRGKTNIAKLAKVESSGSDEIDALRKSSFENVIMSRDTIVNMTKEYGVNSMTYKCGVCGIQEKDLEVKLLKCSSCMAVFYCSKECQKADWKAHKGWCKANAVR